VTHELSGEGVSNGTSNKTSSTKIGKRHKLLGSLREIEKKFESERFTQSSQAMPVNQRFLVSFRREFPSVSYAASRFGAENQETKH
jgi:hypothetical protein